MSDYLAFAKDLALQAGDIMLEYFQIGVPSEKKADNSLVTIADTAVNRFIIEEVAKRFPDHCVRGEEESNQRSHHTYVWVCDPIDGTTSYAYGIPINVFSIALVVDGKPVLGVVYDPYLKRLYSAEKGKGAYLNDSKIHVNSGNLEPRNSVGLGGGGLKQVDSPSLYVALKQQGLRIFTLHSCIYSAMMVAAGQFDAHIHTGSHPHDAASSQIIIEEAGGKVTNLIGRKQRYDGPINGAVISNGLVHAQVLGIIKPYLK